MPRSRRENVSLSRRRAAVADLYIQGWRQLDIANHVGVAQSTVSLDIAAIHKMWRESSIRDFDVLREGELRKLDRLEREAWLAWERSQKPAQAAVMSTDGDRQRTQKTVKEQTGDPRYLDIIHKCNIARRALLGLDAPTKITPTSPDGQHSYHAYVMAELMRLAETAQQGPGIVDADYIEAQVGPRVAAPIEQAIKTRDFSLTPVLSE